MEEARGPAEIGFDDRVLRRRIWLAVAVLSPIGVFIPGVQIFAVFAFPVAIGTLLGARFRTPIAPEPIETGMVEVEADGVRFRGERLDVRVRPFDVLDGWIEPYPTPTAVLRTRRGILGARVPTLERASAILDSCGAAAGKLVSRFRIAPTAARIPLASTFAVASAVLATVFVVLGVMKVAWALAGTRLFGPLTREDLMLTQAGILMFLIAALVTRPRLVEIGRDSIVVHGLVNTRIPLSMIRTMTRVRTGIALTMADGTQRLLDVVSWHSRVESGSSDVPLRLREALFARIAASCSLDAIEVPPERLRILERGGRPVAEYRDALSLLAKREDYRVASLTPAELVAVVGARDAMPEVRVAAAWALSAARERNAIDRAREASHALADERVRARVEQALDGDERVLTVQ